MKQQKNIPAPQSKPASAQPQAAAAPRKSVVKKTALILGLVFLLFLLIFIVPANQIPGFSRLVKWMGFELQEGSGISIGKVAWARLTGQNPGDLSVAQSGEGEVLLFNNQQQAAFNPNGPASALFNADEVNAARSAQGLAPRDFGSIRFAGVPTDRRSEAERIGLPRGQENFGRYMQTKQNRQARQDAVLFGEDVTDAQRGAGIDKATQLGRGKLKKPAGLSGISPNGGPGGAANDWFGRAVDKAWELSVGKDLNKNLQEASRSRLPMSSGSLVAGNREERDLAKIWLLSKASRKPKQPMLRKQLAEAGYLAMELPRTVYDSNGQGSGLAVDEDAILIDFQTTNKQFLKDEDCRKLEQNVSDRMMKMQQDTQQIIHQVRTTVPRSCEDDRAGWKASLTSLETSCRQANDSLQDLQFGCGHSFTKGDCSSTKLNDYASTLDANCDELEKLQADLKMATTPEEKDAIEKRIDAVKKQITDDSNNLTQEDVVMSHNVEVGEGEGEAGTGKPFTFFPTVGTSEEYGWWYDD